MKHFLVRSKASTMFSLQNSNDQRYYENPEAFIKANNVQPSDIVTVLDEKAQGGAALHTFHDYKERIVQDAGNGKTLSNEYSFEGYSKAPERKFIFGNTSNRYK